MSRVIVFDTTLRDGEQSPGASLTSREKLEIARALARLGVDVIEAGFPAASEDDFAAVQRIAREVGAGETTICGLARAKPEDIERAFDAIRDAARPRIHTFLATSPIHRQHKLGMSKVEVIAQVREMVAFARERCEDVEFSAEDACRTEPGFLCEVFTAALEAGATTLVCLGGERVQSGWHASTHFMILAAQSAHGHFEATVLVKEEEPRADPLGLRGQKRRGQGFAGPGSAQHQRMADGWFLACIARLMEIEPVA